MIQITVELTTDPYGLNEDLADFSDLITNIEQMIKEDNIMGDELDQAALFTVDNVLYSASDRPAIKTDALRRIASVIVSVIEQGRQQ
jgi:hypothetical protein